MHATADSKGSFLPSHARRPVQADRACVAEKRYSDAESIWLHQSGRPPHAPLLFHLWTNETTGLRYRPETALNDQKVRKEFCPFTYQLIAHARNPDSVRQDCSHRYQRTYTLPQQDDYTLAHLSPTHPLKPPIRLLRWMLRRRLRRAIRGCESRDRRRRDGRSSVSRGCCFLSYLEMSAEEEG